MVETLTCAAQFMRFDGRTKKFVPCDAPRRVAETYLAREGMWRLPILAGVATAPFLRADGSICSRPGYDATSCLILKIDDESFPSVPERPDRDDAYDALTALHRLLGDFPFVKPEDRAVALSGILTALDRRAMPTAPLHGFTAPTAGTGKSLLVDIIAILAMGKLMPVIAQGRTEEELEKRLGASLLAGDTALSIDNCECPLQSSLLCQALTQQILNIRILGLSRNVETPVNTTVFATGNGLSIVGGSVDTGASTEVVRTLRSAVKGEPNQPPLKLRRSAEALAKAEGGHYILVKTAPGPTPMKDQHTIDGAVSKVAEYLERATHLHAQYRAGDVHVYVPEALRDSERSLEELVEQHLPASHAALKAASRSLFFSLPVAFDPSESIGPYLAIVDRDAGGQPYRFLDMGALIATHAFGENDPALIRDILQSLPFMTSRYAHSEYQTVLSLRLKAALTRIAPAGTRAPIT
jgi:hypothetical protein